MPRMTGVLKVMGWDERAYDVVAGQPTLAHVLATHELTGDIEGEASITYLMGYSPDGSAQFVGLVRITGRVAERAGTFVMKDVGSYENGKASGRWTILPGLGSGDFADIRGNGHFDATHTEASYMLEVEL